MIWSNPIGKFWQIATNNMFINILDLKHNPLWLRPPLWVWTLSLWPSWTLPWADRYCNHIWSSCYWFSSKIFWINHSKVDTIPLSNKTLRVTDQSINTGSITTMAYFLTLDMSMGPGRAITWMGSPFILVMCQHMVTRLAWLTIRTDLLTDMMPLAISTIFQAHLGLLVSMLIFIMTKNNCSQLAERYLY